MLGTVQLYATEGTIIILTPMYVNRSVIATAIFQGSTLSHYNNTCGGKCKKASNS